MTLTRALFWALLGLALSFPALAHDTWLLARPSAVQPGAPVTLELTSGMAFPAPETAIKPERIAKAAVRLAGETAELKDWHAAAKALELTARLSKPGVATLWVELAPRPIDLTVDQVKEYLDEIGASRGGAARLAGDAGASALARALLQAREDLRARGPADGRPLVG